MVGVTQTVLPSLLEKFPLFCIQHIELSCLLTHGHSKLLVEMPDSSAHLKELCSIKNGISMTVLIAVGVGIVQLRSYLWILYLVLIAVFYVSSNRPFVMQLLRSCSSSNSHNSSQSRLNNRATGEGTSPREPSGAANQGLIVGDVPPAYDEIFSLEPLPPSYAEALSKNTEDLQNVADNVSDTTGNTVTSTTTAENQI